MKRWLAAALAATLVVAATPAVGAATFADLTGHWAAREAGFAAGLGLFRGYPDGRFRPDGTVTRAEFVAALLRAVGAAPQPGRVPFADVRPGDWYHDAVATALSLGIVREGDYRGRFGPNEPITRREIARMTMRAVGSRMTRKASESVPRLRDVPPSDPDAPAIEQAVAFGVVTGYQDGTFRPDRTATRAEAAVMLMRALRAQQPDEPYALTLAPTDYGRRWVPAANGARVATTQFLALFHHFTYWLPDTPLDEQRRVLEQFADPALVDEMIRTWRGQGLYYHPWGMFLSYGTHLYTRDAAVLRSLIEVEQADRDGDTWRWTRWGTAEWTFYLRKRAGRWVLVGIDRPLPESWQAKPPVRGSWPYRRVEGGGTSFSYLWTAPDGRVYFGLMSMGPHATREQTERALRELYARAEAGGGQVRMIRVNFGPPEQSAYASLIAELEATDFRRRDPGHFVAFVPGNHARLLFEYVRPEELAGWAYTAFTANDAGILAYIDATPWERLADAPVWQELVTRETGRTVWQNGARYAPAIEALLGR